jgi:hypothetical protein
MKNQIYRLFFFFLACQRTFLCGTLSNKQVVLTGMDNNNNNKKVVLVNKGTKTNY